MNERSHCPYLGLRQNRAIRFASPTSEHRCYVSGEAQDIPVDQRSFCLSVNHLSCPLYTGEWSGTTQGTVTAGGTLALGQRGGLRRLGRRENVFYLALVGLILAITLIWVGIYALYSLSGGSGSPTVAALPTGTATSTPLPPTATPTATPTPTLTPLSRPPMPTGLTALISGRSVELNWSPSTDSRVVGYNVRRGEPQGAFELLNRELLPRAASAYTDDEPPAGQRVEYHVTAVDGSKTESEFVTIIVPVPAAPTPSPSATALPTEPPTAQPAPPTEVVPTPTERVIYLPGPTTIVPGPTVIVPVPVTATPAPTDTPAAPTDTPTTGPTAAPTPIPAATDTPTPPAPTAEPVPPTAAPTDPAAPSDPAPSSAASAPGMVPTVVFTIEPAP